MDRLNYHHLRYFREVAHQGHLGQAAERLNLSQSALSIQIKQLEERLGHALFDRVGRRLQLTEAGRIALAHADRIFGAGQELLATLEQAGTARPPMRVGALSTLSRNFQLGFLQPLLAAGTYPLILKSGGNARLLQDLEEMELDVVLSTEIPPARSGTAFAAQRMAQQEVQLHGVPERMRHDSLEALLREEPLILPTESTVRAGFEELVTRLGLSPRIAADVDDMAMVRLLTREGAGVAVAPSVVLADEIASGRVATAPFELGIVEPFYAVTLPRQFPHPGLAELLNPQPGSAQGG
ncbi:LysR family transcriptional regulator [Roseovarius faecimaris]|uniref:LysR family transcriptional regulator n=1 Tax=Roseovarius faecimaris TaxID=2494550 RepID=A0A6I6IK94_9RHOB|nr:LysR family transcriptional regulator [Roseovarius faecimaris]QGX97025.1 LysR family transcriptional regulator [Roseovarius faecimaris]